MNRQHVFVTGATGFIYQHLVEVLCAQGHQVTCLVRPPIVFGPCDRSGLHFFRMAKRGWAISPTLRPYQYSAIYVIGLGCANDRHCRCWRKVSKGASGTV